LRQPANARFCGPKAPVLNNLRIRIFEGLVFPASFKSDSFFNGLILQRGNFVAEIDATVAELDRAEAEARKIIANAETERKRIVESAHAKARKALEDAEAEAAGEREEMLNEKSAKVKKECDAILAQAEKDAARERTEAKPKVAAIARKMASEIAAAG